MTLRPGSPSRLGLTPFGLSGLSGPSGDEAAAARDALAWAKTQASLESSGWGILAQVNVGAKQAAVEVARRWKSAYWSKFYGRWHADLTAAARSYRHPAPSSDESAWGTWSSDPGEQILGITKSAGVDERFERLDVRAAAVAGSNPALAQAISTWNQVWYSDADVRSIDSQAAGGRPLVEQSEWFKEAWPKIEKWALYGGIAAGAIVAMMILNFAFGRGD